MADVTYIGPGGREPKRRPLLRTIVGDVLRRTRQEQKRTLADVAGAARVSVPYLSEVERGRKEASSEVLAAVCGALRIDLSDLLGEVRQEYVAARKAQDRAVVISLAAARAERIRIELTRTEPARTETARGRGNSLRRNGSPQPHRSGDVVLLAA
ncbi:helix-turn-helix domain-containing protein [Hamadaea tsunoensis]|uniref:helix-turn-helix domain-containing protein n=1 Tax=Hamadaea tsunoensis TaxID=53368 RepID=UPI0004201815